MSIGRRDFMTGLAGALASVGAASAAVTTAKKAVDADYGVMRPDHGLMLPQFVYMDPATGMNRDMPEASYKGEDVSRLPDGRLMRCTVTNEVSSDGFHCVMRVDYEVSENGGDWVPMRLRAQG